MRVVQVEVLDWELEFLRGRGLDPDEVATAAVAKAIDQLRTQGHFP